MTDLEKFYKRLLEDVEIRQQENEDGETQEQAFTGIALEMLSEAGETENPALAFDEKAMGTRFQHKVNGFSVGEVYERLDLIISWYRPNDLIVNVPKAEIDRCATRLRNFFKKCVYEDYASKIAESSEIFELAKFLADPEMRKDLSRVNLYILTNGQYKGEIPEPVQIDEFKAYFRVFDINSLYQFSQNSNEPIEIDFQERNFNVPCVQAPSTNEKYDTYLAIIPGECLSELYEAYGGRLMEQNVRTFLQFGGGKSVNSGIRKTILTEPEMFLAYNNGLSATADSIKLSEDGCHVERLTNLQIVNGGQTTAAIYHTAKGSSKADLSKLLVQVKINIIKDSENYSEYVSRISRCSNTQNKINAADFSSNNPSLLAIEKLSKLVLTPANDFSKVPSHWFFERVRGQYKNQLLKEGFTASRKKTFETKNPKRQVISKVDLAKYINSYEEVYEENQLVIGPNTVVLGNEKNYGRFIRYNLPSDLHEITTVYFEDAMAKAILFKELYRLYGSKNSERCIGELRQVVVPYTIGLLTYLTDKKLNLYKIWQEQKLSDNLKQELFELMIEVNNFIKKSSPGEHFVEWAKKEECWQKAKQFRWSFDPEMIKDDLMEEGSGTTRKSKSLFEEEDEQSLEEEEFLRSLPSSLWKEMAIWGKDTGMLTLAQQSMAKDMAAKILYGGNISSDVRKKAKEIYEIVKKDNLELILRAKEMEANDDKRNKGKSLTISNPKFVTVDLVKRMVDWDSTRKHLEEWKWQFMYEIAYKGRKLEYKQRFGILHNLEDLMDHGFDPKIG